MVQRDTCENNINAQSTFIGRCYSEIISFMDFIHCRPTIKTGFWKAALLPLQVQKRTYYV